MVGSRKAILYLDVLNVLACICVVGMHCNGIVHNFDGSSAWVQSMVVETPVSYTHLDVYKRQGLGSRKGKGEADGIG